MSYEDGFQQNSEFFNWREPYSGHPQGDLLKEHIERAVHDIFFASLKEEIVELVYLLGTEEQVDGLIDKMVNYWKDLEEYEKCSDIVALTPKFKEIWRETKGLPKIVRKSTIQDWIDSSK